jgi:hypothetical protein
MELVRTRFHGSMIFHREEGKRTKAFLYRNIREFAVCSATLRD